MTKLTFDIDADGPQSKNPAKRLLTAKYTNEDLNEQRLLSIE